MDVAHQQRIEIPMPYQFFVIVPYVVAIVSLAVGSRNSRMPAVLGIPFISQR